LKSRATTYVASARPRPGIACRSWGRRCCFAAEGSDPFTSHCHISHVQKYKTETIVFAAVKEEKETHDKSICEAERCRLTLIAEQTQLERGENQVRETMAKFSIYLGANSVTAYNDGVVEHLKYLLENAKSNGDTAQYGDYSAQKQAHEALIEKRRGEIEKNENQVPANQDIVQLLEGLKKLPMYGKTFEALLERKDAQVPQQDAIPIKVSKSGSWKRLGQWLG
jgi:hypothetical protein